MSSQKRYSAVVITRSRDWQWMAFIAYLRWCSLLIYPGERKRHQWKHGSSSLTIKWKARNIFFQKYKSNRKSKQAKLFQEVQKKILKKADYSLNRFTDVYVSLPAHVCHPFYKSCNWDERAQLTQLHHQV